MAIELGWLDIYVELSQLSQHQALPCRGHHEVIYHIFAYLKKHKNGARIVFDPKTPQIDERVFKLNEGRPEPRGQHVVVSCFVDANHAGNVKTRRLHMGILIYVQNAPIIWFSKRQNTVESLFQFWKQVCRSPRSERHSRSSALQTPNVWGTSWRSS